RAAAIAESERATHRLAIDAQHHGSPAVGEERHARSRPRHVLLEQEASTGSVAAARVDRSPQVPSVADQAHATTARSSCRLDDERITDVVDGRLPFHIRAKDAREWVTDTMAREPSRQAGLVRRAADGRCTGNKND